MEIGRKVLILRKKARLTRTELSDKIGLKTNDTLERIEMQVAKPQAWTLLKICQAFDIPFDEMIRDTDFAEGITDFQVLHNQTVYCYRNSDNKKIVLFQPMEKAKEYEGGNCKIFSCAAGRPHMHCCADCEDRENCPEVCQNNPSRCGCYIN